MGFLNWKIFDRNSAVGTLLHAEVFALISLICLYELVEILSRNETLNTFTGYVAVYGTGFLFAICVLQEFHFSSKKAQEEKVSIKGKWSVN
jgi:hypothetical protein